MNLFDYAEEAHKSATYALDPTEIMVGVVSETGEVLEQIKYGIRTGTLDVEKVKLELGDVLWYAMEVTRSAGSWMAINYIACYGRERAEELSAEFPAVSPLIAVLKLSATAGKIADLYSDALVGGSSFDAAAHKHLLMGQLVDLLAWVMVLTEVVGLTLEEVMRGNLMKLAYRKKNGKEKTPVEYASSLALCI